MRNKKNVVALLLVLLLLLSGCAGQPASDESEREKITVYCWSEHMIYSGYAAYVQEHVPEADVVFVTGRNQMGYYEFMEENDALPDILTVWRMSMIDAERLRDSLLDLSETEVAATFNNIYLENYRFEDGSINWLPACGEVEGYIANLDLFAQYNIPLPTDRASFDAACEAFRAAGIVPYSNDFGMDYTCLATLQGLSIQELMTGPGIVWRTAYESGSCRQLDDTIWPAAFERLERQLAVWDIPPEAAEWNYTDMTPRFLEGNAAMMRGTGNDIIAFKQDGMNVKMLPYFGDTGEDNWLLTYPSFNVAVSKQSAEDDAKEALCMKVLDVMFSEGAQNILAGNHNMIPYNEGIKLQLDESMANLKDYIAQNHLYLRLASTEIFAASQETVGKMVSGEYNAKQAYEAFNAMLGQDDAEQGATAVTFEKGYPNVVDAKSGNPAASAMTNTLRAYNGADIVIAHGTSYSGMVYATEYTEEQVDWMVTDNNSIRCYERELTGAELKTLLDTILTREFGGMACINNYSLPVLSGCEMTVRRDDAGYHLEQVTVGGKALEDDDVFSVVYIASTYQAEPMLEELAADGSPWTECEENCRTQWHNAILGSDHSAAIPLCEPAAYLKLVV